MTGTILFGINNIYTVLSNGVRIECRLKGKKLKGAEQEYTPLSPGDTVAFDPVPNDPAKGVIVSRNPRRNGFVRWNRKRNLPQVVAANIDLLVCVASVGVPPFRPRFIDRVLAVAEGSYPVLLVVNKVDGECPEEASRHISIYREIGYRVLTVSAYTGMGIQELEREMGGKCCALVGQSGVGKSTLINTIFPKFELRVGEISEKLSRGRHTTNYGIMLPWKDGWIIDTPGIRELHIYGIESRELAHFMPEFRDHIVECKIPSCVHIDEPGCGVHTAIEAGKIHPERYDSYKRMYAGLRELEESSYE